MHIDINLECFPRADRGLPYPRAALTAHCGPKHSALPAPARNEKREKKDTANTSAETASRTARAGGGSREAWEANLAFR